MVIPFGQYGGVDQIHVTLRKLTTNFEKVDYSLMVSLKHIIKWKESIKIEGNRAESLLK